MTSKIKTKRLRWLAATLMLVAAMVMPSTAWAQESTVTFTAIKGTAGFSNESYDKLIDGKYTSEDGTKWCLSFPSNGAYIIFSASEAIQVTGYSIVTGNDNEDSPGRNPQSWAIYGCNDASADRNSKSWVLIDQKKDYTGLEDVNYKRFDFTLSNPPSEKYQYFKMEITAIQSEMEMLMQMSELILTYVTCVHQWVKTDGVVAPTCTEGGYDVYECSLCHKTKNEPNGNGALGHDWKDGKVVNPTCTTSGYTLQICSRCKAEQKINIVEATGHQWGTDDICDVCGAGNSTPRIPQYGDGSQAQPYQIGTVGELYWFVALVNGNTSVESVTSANPAANATLTADIVVNRNLLSSLQYDESGNVSNGTIFIAWTPIGSSSNPYTGRFNGNNHTISGLYSNYENESNDVGLFGCNSGTIANVGVIDSYFKGGGNVGGVCGYNNSVNNMIATIENCYNTGTVTVSGSEGNVGGVCGYNRAIPNSETKSVNAFIKNCYNTGTVSGNDGYVGGVCGVNIAQTYALTSTHGKATIENCYNTGTVSGNGDYIGGVCGVNSSPQGTAVINNCYYNNDYYTGNAIGQNISLPGNAMGKTTAQFKSGEVCYLLNGSTSTGDPLTWYQNLSAEGGDIHPVLTKTNSNTVYQVKLLCGGGTVDAGTTYANKNEDVIKEHNMPETASFDSEKKIYEKLCQTEGCGKTIYYADAAGSIEATPNADATEFTMANYTLEDATKYDNQAVFTATNFTYNRTFSTTEWTTWYVPFELELTKDICDKYDFSRINNVHQYDDNGDGNADRTVVESFRQTAGVTLKANYPYLVRAKSNADFSMSLPLTNVVPAMAETNSIDCQSVDYKYTFTGTYAGMGDSGSADTAPYTLCDGNKWLHFHSLSPMRHYLTIVSRNVSLPSTASMRSIMLSIVGDEDTTGIVKLYDEERKASETYDLSGRRLPAGSKPRGLIIENGKVTFKK